MGSIPIISTKLINQPNLLFKKIDYLFFVMRLRRNPNSVIYLKVNQHFFLQPKEIKPLLSTLIKQKIQINFEIGMGKGQFILNQALNHPRQYYFGIDLFPEVLAKAVHKFNNIDKKIDNLKIFCYDAIKLLEILPFEQTIQNIYLNFSDPWPKKKHAKRRLTSVPFLSIYKKILTKNGTLCLKTDNSNFYFFSLNQLTHAKWKIISKTENLACSLQNIETEYEQKFRTAGNHIYQIIAKVK